ALQLVQQGLGLALGGGRDADVAVDQRSGAALRGGDQRRDRANPRAGPGRGLALTDSARVEAWPPEQQPPFAPETETFLTHRWLRSRASSGCPTRCGSS